MCLVCALEARPPEVFDCADSGDGQGIGGDTIPDNTGTSFSIAPGVGVAGYINASGDEDWYRITLQEGGTYEIALGNTGSPELDSLLRLYDADGNLVATDDDDGPGLDSFIEFTSTTTGTYYVSAGGFSSNTGEYQLRVDRNGTLAELSDQLINGFWEWGGGGARQWATSDITYNLSDLTAGQANLARLAFDLWADVGNFNFREVAFGADITFQNTEEGAYSGSSRSGGFITSNVVNVDVNWQGGNTSIDSYTMQTFIHEIGHSLGLGHQGNYNYSENYSPTYGTDNMFSNDSWALSIMSYFPQSVAGEGSYRNVLTPQMADIMAIQSMYGAATVRTGDSVYGGANENIVGALGTVFDNVRSMPSFTIVDSGGVDTIDVSEFSEDQRVDLRGGELSSTAGLTNNMGIYVTTVIENVSSGSGNDTLIGNDASNRVFGGAGEDRLYGLNGNDSLYGGDGADVLFGGNGGDRLFGNDGADRLYGHRGNDLLNGQDGNDYLRGGEGNDRLLGALGDDTLLGDEGTDILFGNEGADRLYGGGDDDRLYGNDDDDSLVGGDGNDSLFGGDGADVLIGNDGHDVLYGNEGNDRLYGNEGNDLLNGQSGDDYMDGDAGDDRLLGDVGSDTLFGGLGADRLFGGDGADRLYGGDGNDRLYGGGDADSLYGNDGADHLYGNGGNDLLNGQNGNDYMDGDAGNDRLVGGLGNDVLFGGTGADALLAGDGNDRLYGNDGDDRLYGNDGDDRLYGSSGNDRLYGSAGSDDLYGGSGNDDLHGGTGGDRFVFTNAAGNDRILDFARFEAGEVIDLSRISDITSYRDMLANHLRRVDGELVITYEGVDETGAAATGTITIVDVPLLSSDDFVF